MTETHKEALVSAPLKLLLWPFLIACILTGATLASSSTEFRIDQDTLIPLFSFPAESTDELAKWEVVGDVENTKIEDTGPTIWSKNPNRTSVITLQRFDREKNRDNSFVLVRASVSRADLPYGSESTDKFGLLDSVIVVRSNTESSKKYLLEHLFKLLVFDHTSQDWTTLTRIDPRTSWIKIQLLLQSPGAWTLEQLHISSVSLSSNYTAIVAPMVLLWVIFWFFLLRHIATQLERGERWWLRLIGLAAMAMMMLGAVLSKSVFSPVRTLLKSANDLIAMDLVLHIIAHFVLSIVVLVFHSISWRMICNVLLLNLTIAMFIESVQAHLPHRSANIEDLIYGMAGAVAAIFIGLVCWQVQAWFAKPKSNIQHS